MGEGEAGGGIGRGNEFGLSISRSNAPDIRPAINDSWGEYKGCSFNPGIFNFGYERGSSTSKYNGENITIIHDVYSIGVGSEFALNNPSLPFECHVGVQPSLNLGKIHKWR